MNPVQSSKVIRALLVTSDYRIIQGRTIHQDSMHLPRGTQEGEETTDAAMIRIVREKTGLEVARCPRRVVLEDANEIVFQVELPTTAAESPAKPQGDFTAIGWAPTALATTPVQ